MLFRKREMLLGDPFLFNCSKELVMKRNLSLWTQMVQLKWLVGHGLDTEVS